MVVWGMREAFQEGLSACISGGLTSECRIAQQAFHLCRDERRRKLGPNQPSSGPLLAGRVWWGVGIQRVGTQPRIHGRLAFSRDLRLRQGGMGAGINLLRNQSQFKFVRVHKIPPCLPAAEHQRRSAAPQSLASTEPQFSARDTSDCPSRAGAPTSGRCPAFPAPPGRRARGASPQAT
jgi:hypothetical protein